MFWVLFFLVHSLLPDCTLGGKGSYYDYSATTECLKQPGDAQYKGGLIQNPEFDRGIAWWWPYGGAEIEWREQGSNNFIVAKSRTKPFSSFSQDIILNENNHYTFSAWIQLSVGSAMVQAVFETVEKRIVAGSVLAKAGCWSMLKGGLTADSTRLSKLYFLSNNTEAEIWGDSISLKQFTKHEWRSHQQSSVDKVRKSTVRVLARDAKGKPLTGAKVYVEQKWQMFPFGVAINRNILRNRGYAKWVGSRPFTVTTFEDEMKWYSNEAVRGNEDYRDADKMLKFTRQHNIQVRGHNVFWDDGNFQTRWVPGLTKSDLIEATNRRINSVMTRYQNQVIGWDVVNENLHFSFFEDRLEEYVSGGFYEKALQLDPTKTMFMNEFNVIENSEDTKASASNYVSKLNQIRGYGSNKNGKFGIGLEGHFTEKPNIPYIRSVLDILSKQGAEIWITELDVQQGLDQPGYLKDLLEELHSHPEVRGIVVWGAWKENGCYRMCLTDNNFKNLETGNVVDDFLAKLTHVEGVQGETDKEGMFEVSLFHGHYDIVISHSLLNYTMSHSLRVVADTTHHVNIGATN